MQFRGNFVKTFCIQNVVAMHSLLMGILLSCYVGILIQFSVLDFEHTQLPLPDFVYSLLYVPVYNLLWQDCLQFVICTSVHFAIKSSVATCYNRINEQVATLYTRFCVQLFAQIL